MALTISTALGVTPATAQTAPNPSPQDDLGSIQTYTDGTYLVQLAEQPVAAYDGHVSGYGKTKPAAGAKVDTKSASSQRYAGYLRSKGAQARAKVGNPKAIYEFSTVYPGFAAHLTGAQAQQLSQQPDVVKVTKDVLLQPDSLPAEVNGKGGHGQGGHGHGGTGSADVLRTSQALGLEAKHGLWDQLGGSKKAGSGVIVGVIDTGIWPESKSFDPMAKKTRDQVAPKGWKGSCVPGEDNTFPVAECSDKLIGAKYFVDGFGRARVGEDYLSPRDGDGHGSHTSSTAAGNFGPTAVMPDGNVLGTVSGIAPAASIAMYKACWNGKVGVAADGCSGIDTVAATEAAVADGVDVINYSIGSTTESSYFGGNEIAFMYAAQAGVFVAVSAGNAGPGTSTLDHPSPWLTTTAAATYTVNESTVVLGNGQKYIGASTTLGLPSTPLVESLAAKAAGAADSDATLCFPGSLDPAKVAGKIVLCDRGVNARTEKSFVVQQAGGVGMILLNPSNAGTNGDYHFVPTVHLEFDNQAKYDAIHAYARSAGATAEIQAGVNTGSTTVFPRIIEFSSRGPSVQGRGDLIKPDIAAPGVDVLAASAPGVNFDRSYDYLSGTSMASPHIAGIGALLLDLHPNWSPMMVKSAIMTTAVDTKGGTTSPFDQGAGYTQPNRAGDPGLVYNSGADDWWAFLRGQGCNGCPAGDPLDASDLNLASIAVGDLAGTQTVTRTVTNVGRGTEIYKAHVSGVAGFTVKVTPSVLKVKRGASATFTVTFARTTAPLAAFSTGFLTWWSSHHSVRSPIAVRPVAFAAPAGVTAPAAAGGTVGITITPGADNQQIAGTIRGLVGSSTISGEVAVPGTGGVDHVDYPLTAPATGGPYTFRFETHGLPADDIDLDCGFASSGGSSADETVTVSGMPAGYPFTCTVNGFAASVGNSSPYTVNYWFVDQNTPVGNATIPATTTTGAQGTPVTIPVTFAGLDPAQRYWGWAALSASGVTTRTYINVG